MSCRKRYCKSYRHTPSPPLTPLKLTNLRLLFTTVIENFGPDFVRNIYFVENDIMYNSWIPLYACAASRAICLDFSAQHEFRRGAARI